MLSESQIRRFQESLLEWWNRNGRHFPWRETSDPFRILLAEVLLHRTRAERVVPVYTKMLAEFPTVQDLAHADPVKLKEILLPLGLFWRNRLVSEMAKEIVERFDGEIPQDTNLLKSLPGVSHYIASAVRCFAFGKPEVLLDVNTVRVIGRVFGLRVGDCSRRSASFRKLYGELMDGAPPKTFNFAMIDLGALVCKQKKWLCGICPLSNLCMWTDKRR